MPCGESDTCSLLSQLDHHHHHHHHHHHQQQVSDLARQLDLLQQQHHHYRLCQQQDNQRAPRLQQLQKNSEPSAPTLPPSSNLNLNLNQMMSALPPRGTGMSRGVGMGVAGDGGRGPQLGSPHQHLTVDVNLNHVMSPHPQSPHLNPHHQKSPTSPNPLDNDNLRRQSTGLSAFNDYVDLVKRHLMYAVREEVEILKQQIGDMMERIGQLEYENTLLRAEAKPETLNKLLLPRSTQPGTQQQQPQPAANAQMAASVTQGGTSQPQAQPAVVVVQAQQPTQSIPAGQQTTATMLPPSQQQQQQVTPSGTSTPTPQVPQQPLQQAVQQQQPHHQAPAPQASMS